MYRFVYAIPRNNVWMVSTCLVHNRLLTIYLLTSKIHYNTDAQTIPITINHTAMGLLPDPESSGLRMRFPRHRGLVTPTCITFEVGGGENVPGIPGVCATHNFTYLDRGP